MSSTHGRIFTIRFSYLHFHTEGKLVNTIDALKAIEADHVCLSLTGNTIEKPTLSDQLKRTQTVIHKLRRQGITCDLVLPAFTDTDLSDASIKSSRKAIFSQAARLGVQTLWLDDSHTHRHINVTRRRLLSWLTTIRRLVHQVQARLRLGLIAAPPDVYFRYNLTACHLAENLAGQHYPLLAQSQTYQQDYQRTDILQAAQTLALVSAQAAAHPRIQLIGAIDQPHASSFHKSTEATQMQINLNLLFGFKSIMLNCFDSVGTAGGSEDPYLNMLNTSRKFLDRFSELLPDRSQPNGIGIVVPEKNSSTNHHSSRQPGTNPWPLLLWRLGLPVRMITSAQVTNFDDAFVLTGSVPQALSRAQLKHVFHHGVLLDAAAAETLQGMNLNDMMGLHVGRSLGGVQVEIFSDQSYAAPFYGQNFMLADHLAAQQFRRLRPTHDRAHPITTLLRKGDRPQTEGTVLLDDTKNKHRCAVLPYFLDVAGLAPFLGTARQRHFQDIFRWLLRRRLVCYVEHAADLVCFYLPDAGRNRLVICLLNVGFDWALDSRIRLAQLPFKVKRLRELDEHGRVIQSGELNLKTCRDYQYIQLNTDTAVPPMQMTVLLADG